MKETFEAMKEHKKKTKAQNLEQATLLGFPELERHTIYHWGKNFGSEKFDYWPSTNKYQWRGKVTIASPHEVEKKLKEIKCGCETGCPDCTMPINGGVDLYD